MPVFGGLHREVFNIYSDTGKQQCHQILYGTQNNKITTTTQTPHHQTHALMSLRPPVSALKLLLLSYLSVEAPTTTLLFSQRKHQSPQQQLHPSQ